jgi:hypothetical protein
MELRERQNGRCLMRTNTKACRGTNTKACRGTNTKACRGTNTKACRGTNTTDPNSHEASGPPHARRTVHYNWEWRGLLTHLIHKVQKLVERTTLFVGHAVVRPSHVPVVLDPSSGIGSGVYHLRCCTWLKRFGWGQTPCARTSHV